jgi:pimeloyl-ACP methyl ester carboxylesterase
MTLRRLACALGLAATLAVGSSHPAVAISRFTLPSGRTYTAWKDVPTVTTAILVLHSYNHTDAEPITQGLLDTAARHNFLAVFPNGGGSWNAGLCCGTARATGRDDVGYLADVIADVRARWHPARTYLAGWSNGGMMVERLVVERPELVTRFVVAGSAPEMPAPGAWPGRGWIYHRPLGGHAQRLLVRLRDPLRPEDAELPHRRLAVGHGRPQPGARAPAALAGVGLRPAHLDGLGTPPGGLTRVSAGLRWSHAAPTSGSQAVTGQRFRAAVPQADRMGESPNGVGGR